MADAVVLMGVSGSGKTTVGEKVAARLGWEFIDGDEHHPAANVEKMAAGYPLSDEDRQPWLEDLRRLIADALDGDRSVVVACSALKAAYREVLVAGDPRVVIAYLKGDREAIEERMTQRWGHFMKAGMLEGQLAALEEPEDAIVVAVDALPDEVVDRVIAGLRARGVRTS